MRFLAFLLVLCSLILLHTHAAAADIEFKTQTVTVVWVFDGDTFIFRTPDGSREYEANLMALDAAGWGEDGGFCYALEAAEHLKSLILHKDVTITWDSQDKADRRGRVLVYVEVDGRDVNAEAIRGGYAWVPRKFPADRKNEYIRLERMARQEKAGLWGTCPDSYLKHRPKI